MTEDLHTALAGRLEPTRTAAPWSRRRIGAAITIALVVFAVPQASNALDYTVVPGETLGLIAARHDATIDAIVAANSLADANLIYGGQVLVIPDAALPLTMHTVLAGETLGEIAGRHGLRAADLAAANGIADPNTVREGTVLTITGSAPLPSTGAPEAETHTVAIGETLAVIAARYGTTVAAIVEANGLGNPNLIVEGAVLTIDGPSVPAPPTASAPAVPSQTHTVAAGETLAVIAARYSTTAAALAAVNGINDVNLVVVGMQLEIPAGAQPASTPGVVVGTEIAPLIEQWARVYGVPVDLLKALTWFESGWNNQVVSDVGAIGIGQLMPATVEFVATYLLNEPIDPHDPSGNVRASARFLRYLLDETGWDAATALAAYYQGLASVRQDGIYASSRFYIDGILALRSRF